jgi:hypothetical protein
MTTQMATELMQEQITAFDAISLRDYGISFSNLLESVDTPLGRRQFARLIGVIVKEPFAIERQRPPSESTKARFGLDWKPDKEIKLKAPGTWQLDFIRTLESENEKRPISEQEAILELTRFKFETSLGKFIFESFRNRICDDPKTSAAIRTAIKEAGVKLITPTTASISVGLASVIAVAIASALTPAMAAVASPVIGGIALLIMQIGVDGFCAWSRQVIESDANLQIDD